MKKKQSPTKKFLACSFILLLILLCAAAGWFTWSLPEFARQKYGDPTPRLDTLQKIYLSARLLIQNDDLTMPSKAIGEPRPFQIQLGESPYEISQRLQSEGIIQSARAFRDYLVYSGQDTTIQAGEYILNQRMNTMETARALQDATPLHITFRILPGWRMEEIAAALPTSGLSFSPQTFLEQSQNPSISHPVIDKMPPGASLEGFYFPDSYKFERDSTLEQFLTTILNDFQLKVGATLEPRFANQGLDIYQAVTLASIVQRESIVEEEMPTIASVFLNRLAKGMKLESDPTTQYALGFQSAQETWWKNPLALDDLRYDSPYNTYVYPGLPPGPISNPGLPALIAVAQPAQTPYYYFRAACDGSGRHSFSQTFEEHKSFACP